MVTADQIIKRCSNMTAVRDIHVPTWRECYRYSYPIRMSGFHDEVMTSQELMDWLSQLNDSTTTEAVRVFTAHLMDGMTPSNALWFGMDVGEESDDEKRWLGKASKVIWQNIHNANFDSVAFESMLDAVIAGWFVMFVDEKEGGGYHFEQWPISQCYVTASRAGETVDTVYRKFKLRADQAINEYGRDKVCDKVRDAVDNGKEHTKFEFIHAVEPRKKHVVNARLAKNMPVASYHVCCTSKAIMREGGYHEMPCIVPRWLLLPESEYAVGPVLDALADARTINKVKEFGLINLDMAVGGLWIAEDDGVLTPRNLKIGPRRVIIANSVESMKALQTSTDFNIEFAAEDRIQAQIRKLLLADILPPLDEQPRTATEINMRMQYIRQMLGPIFARLQSEYLQPLIERCFGIAYRAGILGKAPESLANRTFHVKYESPLARAQKLGEVNAIDQYFAGLMAGAELNPDVMDNIDMDKAARYRGEALGVPSDIMPSVDEIAEKRAARQQQQQEQQQQAIGQEIALEAGTAAAKQAVGV
ncbi:MAG: head-tail connector protein [Gammaproteobacteria bacterium]|nr:head-tail connector protein [Gammaproteobacteria bacterium]MBU1833162.1 head-tail connector protein [Gammaproteobacteria bacterium]